MNPFSTFELYDHLNLLPNSGDMKLSNGFSLHNKLENYRNNKEHVVGRLLDVTATETVLVLVMQSLQSDGITLLSRANGPHMFPPTPSLECSKD